MNRMMIAEWSYLLGLATGVVAALFRLMFLFGPAGVNLCKSTGFKPSTLLQFSVLCLVISLASRGW